ncbi:MAG TPA: tail fiber protein [Chloroflexia bacterium]
MPQDPYIGDIYVFAGTYAPRGWAFCEGQILSIAQNQALFSILGTTYGGNGQTTFALPDLRGRVPMHFGQGPGLSPRTLGEKSGTESVTLLTTELPAHIHSVTASSDNGIRTGPANGVWASSARGDSQYSATADTSMNPAAMGVAGSSQPHNNMQPYLAIRFIIALVGVYPSRT